MELIQQVANRFLGMSYDDLTHLERQICKILIQNGLLKVTEDGDVAKPITSVIVESEDLLTHEHQWGPIEHSRMSRTIHQKCQVPHCKEINIPDE